MCRGNVHGPIVDRSRYMRVVGIVGIVANAEPLTETERFVPGASQFVLEVNGGECAKHGIKAGDPTTFINVYGRGK